MAINPLSGNHFNHTVLVKNRNDNKEGTTRESGQNIEQQLIEIDDMGDNPASEQWRYLQSTDDMSAVMAQFYNRRILDNKKNEEGVFNSYDSILDDDIPDKMSKILSAAQNGKTELKYLLLFSNKMFPDDSDLVLVLRDILKKKSLEDLTRKKIQKLLKEVETKSDFREVKAGINCALKAKLFGKQVALEPRMLRVGYREFLFGQNDIIDFYVKWISNFGYKKRGTVVDFIESALLSDINSLDPSCSRTEFGLFLLKINQLQLIKMTDHFFVKKIITNENVRKFNEKESDWLYFFLGILKNPRSIDHLLAEVLGRSSLEARQVELAHILNFIYQECRKIPEILFPDENSRQEILEYFRAMIGKNLLHE